MLNIDDVAVDPDAYENGTKVDLGNGAWVKIRSTKSGNAVQAYVDAARPLMDKEGTTPDEEREFYAEYLSKGVIVDWGGIEGKNGEIAFTPENAFTILSDPKYVRFLDMIKRKVNDESHFDAKTIEADAKN